MYQLPENKVLALRTCRHVEASDWKDSSEMHGLLWGEGDGGHLDWLPSSKWLVVEIESYQDLGGKIKFSSGIVVHCGDQESATKFIAQYAPHESVIVGRELIMDDFQTAIVGYGGYARTGFYGTSLTGHSGVAVAGTGGIAITGHSGVAVAGKGGIAITGHNGTAQTGNGGKSVSGNDGDSISKNNGKSISGDDGTSIVGVGGIAAAGENGRLILRFNYEEKTFQVGEDGVKPDAMYKLDEHGKLVEVL